MVQPDRFQVFAPLVKVIPDQRLVFGRLTAEQRDAANEILDYASAVPAIREWSEAAKARTAILPEGARSLGPLRSMHGPVSAGKLIDIQFNDAEKAVDIGVFVADDESWLRVCQGVYTGFSLGGSYKRRWPDPKNPSLTRYTPSVVEASLVDAPAVPTATFTLIKANGGIELKQLGQPIGIPVAGDQNPAEALNFAGSDAENPVAPKVQAVRAGLEVREIPGYGSFLSPDLVTYRGTDWTDDPYPDPLTGPIYKVLAAVQALINVSNDIEGFNSDVYKSCTVRDQHLAARRIVNQARELGLTVGYDPVLTKIDIQSEGNMAKVDLNGLVSQLAAAIQTGIDAIGSDPEAAKEMLLRLVAELDTASGGAGSGTGSSTSSLSSQSSTPSRGSSSRSSSGSAPSSGGSTVRSTSTPTPPPTSSLSPSEQALADKVDSLADSVNKLLQLQSGSQVRKFDIPAGDLQGLIKMSGAAAENRDGEILTKLLSNGPHSLRDAAIVAGSEEHPDVDAVQTLAYRKAVDSLAESGAFSALYNRHLP